jgi:hypothetical protein
MSSRPVRDRLELDHCDRPFFARLEHPGQNFLPIESFAAAVFLDDHVRNFVDAFITGETPFALQTLPSPANRIAFLAFARIDPPCP